MKMKIRTKILLFSAALMVCICVLQLIFGLFFSRRFLISVRKKETANLSITDFRAKMNAD